MFSLPEIGVFYLLYPIVGIVDMFTEMVSAKESSKREAGKNSAENNLDIKSNIHVHTFGLRRW